MGRGVGFGTGPGRPARLTARAQFVRVQSGGRRLRGRHLLLMVAPGEPGQPARVGLTVSRKVGNAVVRNRVRRVLREAWRLGQGRKPCGTDYVIIALPQAAGLTLAAAQEELAWLLHKAQQWALPPAPATPSSPSTG